MLKRNDPFAIKEAGGDIADRDLAGFADRVYEGSSLGEPGLTSLKRVISQKVPLILWLGALLLTLALVGRLSYLQITQGAYWRGVAEGNRIRLETLPPVRGLITDRNGAPLASDIPALQLVAVPADLPRNEADRQELLTRVLADVPTNLLDFDNLASLATVSYNPRVVAYDLPHDLALQLMQRTAHTPGLSVQAVGERSYQRGAAFGTLLGYVGKLSPDEYRANADTYQLADVIGKTGIEQQYETTLRGQPGRREVEVDALGRQHKVYAAVPSVPGATIQLTIDSDLQNLAYRSLAQAVKGTTTGASVVVMNPHTGEILALASYPGFDPNLFTVNRNPSLISQLLQSANQPFFNRPVSGAFPIGSTVKPMLAAAGLQEGVITPTTTVLSTGGIQLGNRFFADWKPGGHGIVNVYGAIAESVNTFFYILGGGTGDRPGLGIDRIASYLKDFLIGQALHVDLPGEQDGFIPTPAWKEAQQHDRWYQGDTYNVSIGQGGLLVTPLHLAEAYSAILNNGTLPAPHLVKAMRSADGTITALPAASLGQVNISAANLEVIRQAMRQTITSGSARSLGSLPIAVAGKTGTAQTGTKTQPHGWFAGFAPYNDPQIVVVVMIEYGGEGSTVAVPVARELFNWYASHQTLAAAAQPK